MNIATDIVIAIEKEICEKKMLKVLSIVVDLSKKVFFAWNLDHFSGLRPKF